MLRKLIYFSDGVSSQYKNRKNFSNLCIHKSDFDLDVEWNFFATAHGKNACDGVGAVSYTHLDVYKRQTYTTQ